MRHRVEWFTRSTTYVAGQCGQETTTWTSQGTFWCELTPIGGQPIPNADRLVATRRFRIRMRYVGNVTEGDRFVYEGRDLIITSAYRSMEKTAYLFIEATEQYEGAAGGP